MIKDMNILDFAKDGNADEVYAKIREFNFIVSPFIFYAGQYIAFRTKMQPAGAVFIAARMAGLASIAAR